MRLSLVPAMTEEEAIEYLIMKDIPQSVWQSWDEGNRPKMVICRKRTAVTANKNVAQCLAYI